MNRTVIISILFSLCCSVGLGQTWENVKSSDSFLYGEGWGTTVAEADQQALHDLIGKISMQVSGEFKAIENEKNINGVNDSKSEILSVVNTYSSATLTNTQKVILQNEPNAYVGRWIRRADLNKIFEGRKAKISDYITSGLKAESKGKIDVALKDFYWALALTRTLQYPNAFKYEDEEGETFLAMSWLPAHINEIFDNISVGVTHREVDDVNLFITYKGKPVSSIDYTFFDGRDWSNIYSARDGAGVLELAPGSTAEDFKLRFEYEFRGEAHIDNELESVLASMKGIPMPKAYKSVKAKADGASRKLAERQQIISDAESATANSFASVSPAVYQLPNAASNAGKYQQILNGLIKDIESKRYDASNDCFTQEGLEIYRQLIKYGSAKLVGKPSYEFFQDGDNVIARGLQMSFSFKSGMRKSFVEDVVFTFDGAGKICNISFGLGKTAEADILGKGVWSQQARFAIMNFLENYQTAYALKRLEYISSIFDDDAVIITGSVMKAPVKRMKSGDNQGVAFGGDIVKYNRHTKDSYLKDLARSFASKEFINIRFANNDVRKLGVGGELYAIQISQEYYSSNYGDKGYLFLMVDINDPENPIIKVRTWQPEKDPDFGLYGPEHFK